MNHLVKKISALTAGTLAASAIGVGALATSADATPAAKAGDRSIAKVLAKDKGFDKNWQDFDILEAAVLAVIQAKPDSPVALLTDGGVRLTVFAPTDEAFRQLVKTLTGTLPKTEKATVAALLEVADVDTIEQVLLYHVVPGKTLTSPKVVKAAKAGTKLETAEGATVKVVDRKGQITLVDKAKKVTDPTVNLDQLDINKGNKQIAHGIDRVLLPISF